MRHKGVRWHHVESDILKEKTVLGDNGEMIDDYFSGLVCWAEKDSMKRYDKV